MTVTIDSHPMPKFPAVERDPYCEMCDEDATVVLSVPSQGLTVPLCQVHQQMRVLELERTLTGPFHVTGLEAAPSAEDAAKINASIALNALDDQRDLNAHLQRRVQNQSADLTAAHLAELEGKNRELEQAAAENNRLQTELARLQSERVNG